MFKVENLVGGYGKNIVFDNVSFSADKGDMVYVLGANGSGKTTLFNILIGYKAKKGGDIKILGKSIDDYDRSELAKNIAYIPQSHTPAFNYIVKEMVVMGRACHIDRFSEPSKDDYNVVYDALKTLGISHLADKEYMKISGGQRQLVLVARAICQQAKILIMDEPLSGLDFVNQAIVTNTLKKLSEEGYIILMSTHNMINNYKDTDKILLVGKEKRAFYGQIEEIIVKGRIADAYGMPISTITNIDENGGKHLICIPM